MGGVGGAAARGRRRVCGAAMCCGSPPHEGGPRTARPAVSMSFLFSFERKAAKTLAMHAESSAATVKSAAARERAVRGGLVRAARGGARQRAKRSDGPHEGPNQRAKGGPRGGAGQGGAPCGVGQGGRRVVWHAVVHAVVHAGAPSSLIEARHTPPMTGIRQSHLALEMDLP